MRNILLALTLGLTMVALPLAAEQKRDWQTGQVVESRSQVDSQIHSIAVADKTYYVRGAIATQEDALAVGSTVRFALERTTMFVSVSGKEYKLTVLGASARPSAAAAPAAVSMSGSAGKTESEAGRAVLDNDAVVKMIAGGLKADTVAGVIQSRPGQFVLTPDARAGLKAAGVPQSVIEAMAARMKGQP